MRTGKGWRNEPLRHSLARRGVYTGRKIRIKNTPEARAHDKEYREAEKAYVEAEKARRENEEMIEKINEKEWFTEYDRDEVDRREDDDRDYTEESEERLRDLEDLQREREEFDASKDDRSLLEKFFGKKGVESESSRCT